MRIFILDNTLDDIKSLQEIVYDAKLGTLIGKSNNALEGLEEIITLEPDLVILDMINEGLDGIHIIKEIRKRNKKISFILISKADSKDIVEKAYQCGVEYFIYKPINKIEIENVINKFRYRMELENKLGKVQQIFNDIQINTLEFIEIDNCEQGINDILLKLGIMGEIGSEDIFKITRYMLEKKVNIHDTTIREICLEFTNNAKSMEQRIRRTISIAMSNIASLGIEDYMNETFLEYSNTLFNFEQVKREMDYIRGKSMEKGSVNMRKFLYGISIYCEKINN